MARTKVSPCGRFVVVDRLHLDREVFDVLARWAAQRGVSIQDAIQLAACALVPPPASSARMRVRPPPSAERIE